MFSGRTLGLVATYICLYLILPGMPTAQAQQTPTAEQIEIFRNLPPEQQQAILDSLGRDTGDAETSGVTRDRSTTQPETERRGARTRNGRDALSQLMITERDPRLKPQDTLLVSLQIRQFEERGAAADIAGNRPDDAWGRRYYAGRHANAAGAHSAN